MLFSRTPLLVRLRRHRGLWVLAVAVLLIKLATGTICLADGPGARLAFPDGATAISAVAAAVDPAVGNDDGTCVLGEAGGCHCVCAHSLTLPATVALALTRPGVKLDALVDALDRVPTAPASLIRPPIA
ncbi:hypothetical protein B1991_08765 [Rhodanobacter lindaniclasticus]|uniref:Uncharacterized protein n=1 Tax=Rhodanobacter lindaniclasticus TaxID=75310 RepID=A0A4S3KFT3_9GAMM|nr:hypothetical protein B1991_08765 [Rhodanobacter lindaniclasticus]